MSKNNNKSKLKKTNNKGTSNIQKRGTKRKKKKIRIGRLLIVILLAVLCVLGIGKSVVWIGQSLKNIEKNVDKEEDTQQVENTLEKQYNLDSEVNKDQGKKYTILIDPGHGGNDKGTQSKDGKVLEKDLTLILSKRVANKLSKHEDVQVMISRTDDKYISPKDRAVHANEEGVDLFISMHLNAESGGSTASGVETYYKRGAVDGSGELAQSIQKSIKSYVDVRDRGYREDSFQVIRDCQMPSVLIECGFLTNPEETKKLLTEEYQESLTEGIVQGILSYLDSDEDK